MLTYLDLPDLPEDVEDPGLVAGGDCQLVEAPQLVEEHLGPGVVVGDQRPRHNLHRHPHSGTHLIKLIIYPEELA